MIEAYKKFWTNYVNFNGRSSLSDFWWVVLCNFIVGFIIGIIAGIIPDLSFLSDVYVLAAFVPGLALSIRRLHDTNRSGWTYLYCLIPIVGGILLIIWLCGATVDTDNKYGEKTY